MTDIENCTTFESKHWSKGDVLPVVKRANGPIIPTLPLSLMRIISRELDPHSLFALSMCCRTTRKLEGLPIDFCNVNRCFGKQFFMTPEQLISFAKEHEKRFNITGALLFRCGDEEVAELLKWTPRLESLIVLSTFITSLSALKAQAFVLKRMVLQNASVLTDMTMLNSFTNLSELKITWSCCIPVFPSLHHCHNLREIDLYQCQDVRCIKSLSYCKQLRRVNISCLSGLTDISAIAELPELQELDMSWCESLADISPIRNCSNIEVLNLCHCTRLKNIEAVADLHDLRDVNMAQCRLLWNLLPLSECQALENLKLFACKNLCDLRPLSCCGSLTTLDLSYCRKVKDVEPLTMCFELVKVNLTNSDNITNIEVLENLNNLQILR